LRKKSTFQHFNFTTFQQENSVLRQHDAGKHSIPERRGITHRSEAQGKKKMTLYAQHGMQN